MLPGHLTVSGCYKLSLLSRWQDEKRPELHSVAQRLIIHDLPLNMYATATSLHMSGGFKCLYGPETVHVSNREKVIVFFCFYLNINLKHSLWRDIREGKIANTL